MKSTLKPWVVIVLVGALGVLAICGGAQAAQAAVGSADPPGRAVSGAPAALPDPDPASTGDTYTYTAVVPPGRPVPDWASYGRVLWKEGEQALLAMTPADAERLVEAGAEIALVDLTPQVVPARPAAPAVATPVSPDPMIQGMIDQVASTTVATYDRQLSGDLPAFVGGSPYTIATRNTYSITPIQKATQFVGEHLAELGYSVEYHVWGSSGTPSTYPNVIGELPGQTAADDIFIIGAHVDDMPSGNIAPGADDNASGSAAVMVAADILSQYYWGCTLRFALWTGEEQGLLGSQAYATRSFNAGENIRGYLNLDMVGYNGTGLLAPRELSLYWKSTVPASQQIADMFISVNSVYGLGLIPFKYDAAISQYYIGNYSDNKSFWDRLYPAILTIEDVYGDETPHYHSVNDTYSTLDLDYFTRMVKASVGTFAHMTGCLIADEPIRVTPSLAIKKGVALRWYHTAPSSVYEVWRNLDPANPYFTPGDGECELRSTAAAPNLGVAVGRLDTAVAGNPDQNRYYLVLGIDGESVVATSQRIGEFSFTLMPGAAGQ